MSSLFDTSLQSTAPVDDAAGDEVLYRNERTLVTRRAPRGRVPGVVFKQALGADAARRLQHEAGILQRLAGVEGVPRIAPLPTPPHTLALHDDGGTVLARLRPAPDLPAIVELGLGLARVLAGVHRRGVIHKDINPSNILVHGPGRLPTLIDFNIASSAAEERPGFAPPGEIAGTLHYMAPEQTGRTGRPVDLRADLYALGVVLYQLATGRLPFEGDDLLDLIHDHLTQVPAAPAQLRPQVPRLLSDLILRLLEKEPDRRYQSADGLRQDLECLHEAWRRGDATPFALGEHDFPMRLSAPSRPVGRDAEIAALQRAVDRAQAGQAHALLIGGAPGVGKSALVGELRALVAARRGWFVSGKFDAYRQDARKAAVEPLRALGRLLLAEPEDRLARHRERILQGLGVNTGFGPALLPEFALLLGAQPPVEVADPREAETRMVQACVDLLRSIACAERPVVMVFDDLQWAPPLTLRLFDAVVAGTVALPGLLLVGAYRSGEVDAAHPLGAALERWRQLGRAPAQVQLHNLPAADMGLLIGQMLRLPVAEAQPLAQVLDQHAGGNPYDTVELVNALRQDGLLERRDGRWAWEAGAIRRYAGHAGVVDLLGRRLGKLPVPARGVLEVMACLGGASGTELLAFACGMEAEALTAALAPSLEEGLLASEPGAAAALRFRHDRVQQAVVEGLGPQRHRELQLRLARRLAQRPALWQAAAEQYLPVVEALGSAWADGAERRRVVALFQQAAAGSRVLNYAVAERFLAAAIRLLEPLAAGADDAALLQALAVERHAALYSLGRSDEADQVYAAIVAGCSDAAELAGPAGIQMYSLTHRTRYAESLALGLALLSRLGLQQPDDLRAAIAAGLQRMRPWQESAEALQRDFDRPEPADPQVQARARLIVQTANAGFFCDPMMFAWLVLEANRLWIEHGPSRPLMASSSGAPFLLVSAPQDYRGACTVARHLVAVGEARGYMHGAAMARCNYGVAVGHWVEPLEQVVQELHRAREDLLQAGDVTYSGYTYISVDALLDCAPTLDTASAELEAGLAFFTRAGNTDLRQRYLPRRQLIRALRGETHAPGGFSDAGFDEAVQAAGPLATSPTYPMLRAVSAAVFADAAGLEEHSARAMALLPRAPGYYLGALARVLRAMALAGRARALPLPERGPLLAELDANCRHWLGQRAAEAPFNFLHLLRWVEAERAWAAGDVWAAGATFDAAMQEAAQRSRPWHHALITERAARFQLALGMEAGAQRLLKQACALYAAWGAAGKVRQMQAEHACLREGLGLRPAAAGVRSTVVGTDVVDMMAVLRASQALSSETHLAGLTGQLARVLGAMTGAEAVQLLVRPDERPGWFLATSLAEGAGGEVPVEQAGAQGLLPLSVFRYVLRTRETLLLDDAARDDRFTGDPCFAGADAPGSLLCAPIQSHGELRGMLMLQSRQRRAFSAERTDALMLIAGQMSVSLNNALLYASLERKVAERTAALEAANRQLEQISHTDALTGLANRRRFNEALEAECLRARRSGLPLGLVLIDIDHFKLYNDHHGHQGGDACLQLVAQALTGGRRGGGDLVARYGGEEFAILLPDTGLEGAAATAERVRLAVEALRQPHAQSPLGQLTVSIGVAAFGATAESQPAHWVQKADAALYAAKRGGRNRVVAG